VPRLRGLLFLRGALDFTVRCPILRGARRSLWTGDGSFGNLVYRVIGLPLIVRGLTSTRRAFKPCFGKGGSHSVFGYPKWRGFHLY